MEIVIKIDDEHVSGIVRAIAMARFQQPEEQAMKLVDAAYKDDHAKFLHDYVQAGLWNCYAAKCGEAASVIAHQDAAKKILSQCPVDAVREEIKAMCG